ncbi:hypothetical protein CBR_g49265 [Chara braunii]|uniref:Uncharacterized protein n=1 Tax=Chara braunii TaxID=69332 RepID=A0A388M4F6_CHABU|nr:hypothetical protein CBR_g49265 [Chara braunii]|eukprot:GBG89474.1 hypothetical protein CBR_g49265 [Chara braunii]
MAESKQRAEASAAARKKREAEAARLRRVAEDQRQKHAAAAAKAVDEERVRRREILFKEETALLAQAKDWQKEAENGDSVDYGTRIALLLNRVTDLLATCIAQQEDIHSLDHANQTLTKRIQQLEQRPVATSSTGPSDLVDRVNVLEMDVGTLKTETQRLDQQNSMPSGDWISEFQRLASTPKLPLNFDDIKLYFIKRSCPALQNALTQVAENLNTSEELFNKAAQIIVMNLEAKNIGRSSTVGQGAYQHRPKVAVVATATPSDPSTSNEAASSDEGDKLAAAQNGGRPAKGRGRDKTKTNTTSSGPGQAAPAQEPWAQYGLTERGYRIRSKYCYCLWCNSAAHETVNCPTKAKGPAQSGK